MKYIEKIYFKPKEWVYGFDMLREESGWASNNGKFFRGYFIGAIKMWLFRIFRK